MASHDSHMVTRILDNLLDITVILSYTKLGYQLRKHWWDTTELSADLSRHVCLVTGASSGLGLETARKLAILGARIILVVRNERKGNQVRETLITETNNKNIQVECADLGDIGSLQAFAGRFLSQEQRLDVLVNNAGVMQRDRLLSADGYELSFATNILGPFLFTHLLLPLLRQSAPSRIINVSSGGMYTQKLDVKDMQFQNKPYNGVTAYAQAKRAQVILTEMWAKYLQGTGVTVNAMHPGWVDTPGLRRSLPGFYQLMWRMLRTPAQGVDTIIWLACSGAVAGLTGKFWFDRQPRSTHLLPWTRSSPQDRQMLWDTCVDLCGLQA